MTNPCYPCGDLFPGEPGGTDQDLSASHRDLQGTVGMLQVTIKFFSSSEVLAFGEHSQTQPGHVLKHNKTDLVELLGADLGRAHNALDWEEDEVNAFSVSPWEVKTCPGQLVSVSHGDCGCLFPVPHFLLPRGAQLVLRLGCSGRHGCFFFSFTLNSCFRLVMCSSNPVC